MNRGLIVGKVYRPNGTAAGNATVFLSRVYGGSGLLDIKKIYGKVESNGKFTLPFLWSGTSFADDLTVITAQIGAWTDVVTKQGRTTTSTTNAQALREVRCVVMRDAIGQLGAITNTFGDIPEIADSAISLAAALKNWSGLVPFWKTNLWTTEGWLMIGASDIFLK